MNFFHSKNIYFLLVPLISILAFVLILPSIWAGVLSFYEYRLGTPKVFRGVENYIEILKNPDFLISTVRTLMFMVFSVIGGFVLGIGMSLLLVRGFKLQKLWVSLLITPYAVSSVVGVVVWKYQFNPDFGIINFALAQFGINNAPNWFIEPMASFIAILIIDIWLSTPFIITIIYPSIMSISPSLYEAAQIDGSSYYTSFRYVTIPLIKPAIVVTLTFRMIYALRIFGPIWIFNRGGPIGATKVLSIYLYEQGFLYWKFGIGSAIAILLLIVTMVVSLPQIRTMQRTMFE